MDHALILAPPSPTFLPLSPPHRLHLQLSSLKPSTSLHHQQGTPPAYVDPSSSADEDRRSLNPRLAATAAEAVVQMMAGSVLAFYVLSTSTLLLLFWACVRRRPASRMMAYPSFVDRSPRSDPRRQRPRLESGYGLFTSVLPPVYPPAGAALSDGEAIQCNA